MSDRKEPKPVASAIGAALAEVDVTPIWSKWTDEQWAEHDARVAQALVAIQEPPSGPDLSKYDWPERAARFARQADLDAPAVRRILDHDFAARCIVVLSGAPGVGKTVAAASWTLRDRRGRVRFVRASTFAASSRYDASKREIWFDAPALVLDDLGAEYLDSKGSFLVDLDELIDTYYGAERPLVMTTNLGIDDFKRRYGARVQDRLRECGRWISIPGNSLRSSGGAQ